MTDPSWAHIVTYSSVKVKVLEENCRPEMKQYDGSYTGLQEHMVFKGQKFLMISVSVRLNIKHAARP